MNVAIWIRVSSDGQDEANQVPDLERYCNERGYRIVKRYTVHAKSAYHGDHQTDLDRALADMRSGQFDKLIIWHSDRIERRPGKALLDTLAEFGPGNVESVQEPALGQLDFGGQVVTFISGLMNHEKSAHIAQQVKLAHDRIREAGALQGRPPFGYTTAGPKYGRYLVPVEWLKPFVVGIFERYDHGKSLSEICAWLDANEIAPPFGEIWSPKSVAQIIRNTTYIGYRTDSQGRILHLCEAIVDGQLRERAVSRLGSTPRGRRGPVSGKPALLTGVLFCGRCHAEGTESPMYRTGMKQGFSGYYRCAGKGTRRKGCGLMVHIDVADLRAIEMLSLSSEPWTEEVHVPGNDHSAELRANQVELSDLNARMDELDDDDYMAKLVELRTERKRLMGLPTTPPHTEIRQTGETVGQHWLRLNRDGRRQMMKDSVRFFADRTELGLMLTAESRLFLERSA